MSQTSASNELLNKPLLSEGQLDAGAFDLVGGRNACRSFFMLFLRFPPFSSCLLFLPCFISSAVF